MLLLADLPHMSHEGCAEADQQVKWAVYENAVNTAC
jgi:hypothetical protein